MALKNFSRSLRRNQTEAEKLMWALLRHRRLSGFKFRRQQPLGPYIADFFCKERGLILEIDGGQHLEGAGKDQGRTGWLAAKGFHVLRFWDHEVLKNSSVVLQVVWKELQSLPPHPNPLPRGEGKRKEPFSPLGRSLPKRK